MTFDETKFSHITVTSDDEDDVVIQAGVRVSGSENGDVAGGVAASEPATDVGGVDAGDGALEPLVPVASASEPDVATAADADSEERDTRIEDLEVGPMPMVQKVVIALAVLFIIAFAVYYVLFL